MKNTIENYFQDVTKKELLYQANKISVTIQEGNYLPENKSSMALSQILNKISKEEKFRILVINKNGIVANDSNGTHIGKTLLIPEVMIAFDGKNIANYRKNDGVIYASSYIEDKESNNKGVVLLISSFEDSKTLILALSKKWIFLTGFISILIGIFILFALQMLINPIKKILRSINEISNGKLHHRVKVKGSHEISKLSEAFNTMTEKLEQIDTSRQEFVSNVSHELKTPLSSIKVLSDALLLQKDAPLDMYKEFLQDINSEIDRMTEIVNNLLALVKLDNKTVNLNIEETSLNMILDELIKRLQPLAEQKNINLIYEPQKNITIDADKFRLGLAISNLIENAIKYTDEKGDVKVTIESDHQNAFVTILDTGIGINEEEQSKIFNRFYRVDKTRDRETGGTGLGLSITHSIIMLHNGSIKISSKENEGSTFTARVPLKYVGKSIF